MTPRTPPTPSNHPAASAENGDAPSVVVNDLFLSPRVIDRRAYAELAGEIRELLHAAQSERAALTAALDQTGRADQDFRQREAAQAVNLDLCAKALRKIDEKTARIDQLIARADDVSGFLEQFDARCEQALKGKLDSLEARVEAIQAAAAAKTGALEERLRTSAREIEQRIDAIRRDADTIIAPSRDHLNALCERAAALAGREPGRPGTPIPDSLLDMLGRAEGLAKDIDQTTQRLASAHTIAAEERASFDTWLTRAREQVETIERSRVQISGMTSELTQQAERTLSSLRARIAEQESKVESRALEMRDEARRSIDDIALQADRIVGAARARLNDQEESMQLRAVELRDDARRAIGDLESRLDVAREQAQAALLEVKPRTDAILEEMRETMRQAQDAHNTTGLALKLLQTASARAETLEQQLRPWQTMLGEGESAVPMPIRKMLESVRAGMQSDLGRIADALRDAAGRAEAYSGGINEHPMRIVVRTLNNQAQSAD